MERIKIQSDIALSLTGFAFTWLKYKDSQALGNIVLIVTRDAGTGGAWGAVAPSAFC